MTRNYLLSPNEKNYYYDIILIDEFDVTHFENHTKTVLAFIKHNKHNTPVVVLNVAISLKFLSYHPSNPLKFKYACDTIKTSLTEYGIEVTTGGHGIETFFVYARKRDEIETYMTQENTIKYTT